MENEMGKERKLILDKLYHAFEIVAEGSYVYLCDMKYDYSRWSEEAVQYFGLPGKYMYHAGDIWEEHIHPADQKSYHESIQDISEKLKFCSRSYFGEAFRSIVGCSPVEYRQKYRKG